MAPFPSPTETWHTDSYPAIDPTRPDLSVKGKRVVVTGGGGGIGRGFVRAFAAAGAASIAILGRREGMLKETKQAVEADHSATAVSTHVVDVVSLDSTRHAAAAIGTWDILVCNAGYLSTPATVVDSDPEDWWKSFEVNVKGSFNVAKAFLPTHSPEATVIGINAGSIQMPLAYQARISAYNASKFAALSFFTVLAVENPDLHVVSMHPGVVATDMFDKGQMAPTAPDTIELPAHFAVWLCSGEAKFLRAKMVWCNWDVDELVAKKGEIEGGLMLTPNCLGWPYNS